MARLSDRSFWALLGAGALVGVAGVVLVARYQSRPRPRPAPAATGSVALETLPAPSAPAPAPRRHIEVAGIRTFYNDRNQPQVHALVINHGEDSLHGAVLEVSLRALDAAEGSSPLARFTVKIERDIKAGEFQEVRAPLETFGTLAALPPWQQLRADVERR